MAGSLFLRDIKERMVFDWPVTKAMIAYLGVLTGLGCCAVGRRFTGLMVLAKIHRSNFSLRVDRFIVGRLSRGEGSRSEGAVGAFAPVYEEYIRTLEPSPHTRAFFQDPSRMLGSRVIVLKSAGDGERGVLLIDYNFAPPVFAKLFDLNEVANRYFLVLEPGWSGYCTPEILCYTTVEGPVFIQAYEPRDAEFLRGIGSNLVPVPLSTNFWVDDRVMRPLPGVKKEYDLIMVAAWAGYKRHEWFFSALRELRRKGSKLSAILIGYPGNRTRDEVWEWARYFGVEDQVVLKERIPPELINLHLNQSKVNVVWSRKEGVNRAIIEGMFAGVPCVVRRGFNYNYSYEYINDRTGCFSGERELPTKLQGMLADLGRYDPRRWVSANMTCQRSTEILNGAIRHAAICAGQPWSRDIAVKTAGLHGLRYWNSDDLASFEADYAWLRSIIRSR